ncbi:hypothetical protein N0V92_011793 [Colletotrichum tropicale]|nr:hypothetical protein N0V92_011793 [Colletotrichum tropicale]
MTEEQTLEKFAVASMPIDVQPIVAADLRRCAEIEHDAFAESPSYPVLFPGPLPDDPLALRVEGLEKELREDPTVRFLKAVDTELQGDEAIVAWAKFNSYPEGLPVPKPRVPPPGSNAEACTALFVGIDKMRERLMTGKPCVCKWPLLHPSDWLSDWRNND